MAAKKTILRRLAMLVFTGGCVATLYFGTVRSEERGDSIPITPGDAIANHLNVRLPRELFANFDLFIYVDKAERGPFAQQMFVFKRTGEDLALLYAWPVSTGREGLERDARGRLRATITPVGYYELDPKRQFIAHVSSQWNEEMPYAMFFDWKPNGRDTGFAIHGARGDRVASLGIRASAGCVRLSEEHARMLFSLVKDEFYARVPVISYVDGSLARGVGGQLVFRDGYSVLVVVDNYVGESRVTPLFSPSA